MKKSLSVLLAVIMICGTMTLGFTTAFAAETQSTEVVSDEDNPVVGIEVINDFVVTYQEGVNGYVYTKYDPDTGEEDEFFYYNFDFEQVNEAKYLLTYKDGSTKIISFGEQVGDYSIQFIDDQESDPWLPNKYNYLKVFFGELETKITVVIIPSPVKSLEVVNGLEKDLVENEGGYYGYDIFGKQVYMFDITPEEINNILVKINFNDGTSQLAKIGDNINGETLEFNDYQFIEPWKPFRDNYYTVSYMDKRVEKAISVIPSKHKGDVNNDGFADIFDAVEVQKYTADNIALEPYQFDMADVNYDGEVDILDATIIQKYAAGKISEFTKAA